MMDRGVELISVSDGFKSTFLNPSSIAMMGIQYEFENKTRYQRTFGQREDAVRKGKHSGGRVPFGYIKNEHHYLEIDPIAAPIVRKIFDEFLSGEEITEIARKFEKNGYRRGEKEITYYDVSRILKNKIYTGHIYLQTLEQKHNGPEKVRKATIVSDYRHPAIILDEEYEIVQKRLNARLIQKRKKHFHLLSKILYCFHCDQQMIPQVGDETYFCRGSHKTSSCKRIKKAEVEHKVLQHFLDLAKDKQEEHSKQMSFKLR